MACLAIVNVPSTSNNARRRIFLDVIFIQCNGCSIVLSADAVNSGEFFALTTCLLPLALINIDDVGSRYHLRRDDVI